MTDEIELLLFWKGVRDYVVRAAGTGMIKRN